MASYRTKTDTNTYISNQLVNYRTTTDSNTYIATQLANYAQMATIESRFFEPLPNGNPPNFIVQSGLNAIISSSPPSINLSLNYSEVRPNVNLTSGSSFKVLQANNSGNLVWDGAVLATQSFAEPAFSVIQNEIVKGFDFANNRQHCVNSRRLFI